MTMACPIITFAFAPTVPVPEAEATLRLAVLAVESLHGADRVRLELHVRIDRAARRIVIDASTDPGRTLAAIFSGYIRREFGDDAVQMERAIPLTEERIIGAVT
jgi:hypothetical protein